MNQALVDDNLVDMDKIGAANFFWSFPSKVVVIKQNAVKSLQEQIAKVRPPCLKYGSVLLARQLRQLQSTGIPGVLDTSTDLCGLNRWRDSCIC